MELEGEDGSKIALQNDDNTVFGRGLLCPNASNDRTVSRRHVLFEAKTSASDHKLSFEVIGKNPMWVRDSKSGEVQVFRGFEKGEVAAGDCLCFSGTRPFWFFVRRSGVTAGDERVLENEDGVSESLRIEFGFDGADVSDFDPVKEFGFLVMGHEFDLYPNQMIRDIKKWDWFLEEPRKDGDDDDELLEKRRQRGLGRKRKKDEGNDDDDDWKGESDDDKELVTRLRKVEKTKYSTRSKDCDKPRKGTSSLQKNTNRADEEDDEDDETLGGFIVDDENVEQEEETEEDEDEDEFFEEDDNEEVDD